MPAHTVTTNTEWHRQAADMARPAKEAEIVMGIPVKGE